MKIIIFRNKADRDYYCDLKLAQMFGGDDPTAKIRRAAKVANRWAIAFCVIAGMLAWNSARAEELNCMAEAVTFESAVRVANARKLTNAFAGYRAWWWMHGCCIATRDERELQRLSKRGVK